MSYCSDCAKLLTENRELQAENERLKEVVAAQGKAISFQVEETIRFILERDSLRAQLAEMQKRAEKAEKIIEDSRIDMQGFDADTITEIISARAKGGLKEEK